MKFSVMAGSLGSAITCEAALSDDFRTIFSRIQEGVGTTVSLEDYDMYISARSSSAGDAPSVVGPLRPLDTPNSIHLDDTQKDPHVLLLVRKKTSHEHGSVNASPSPSTACSSDAGGEGGATSASLSPGPSPRVVDEYRRRMRAMYLTYDPQNLYKVEVALDRYSGYEDEVLQQLVKRYGPEPPLAETHSLSPDGAMGPAASPLPTSSVADGGTPRAPLPSPTNERAGVSYHDRLVAMYATYEPQKLSKVKGTLKRFVGREEEVIQQLVKKYGPEPRGETGKTSSLMSLTIAPCKHAAADSVQLSPRQTGESNCSSTGATPTSVAAEHNHSTAEAAFLVSPSSLSYRERLRNLYFTYEPRKLRLVEGTLNKYKGREEEVIKHLVRIYGPEPPPQIAAAASMAAAPPTHETPSSAHGGASVSQATTVTVHPAPTSVAYEAGKEPLTTPETGDAAFPENANPSAAVDSADEAERAPSQSSDHSLATTPASPDPQMMREKASSPHSERVLGTATDIDHYRQRMVALYCAYNPSKLHTVEGTLKKFSGKEELAIQQLVRRYGAEPTRPNSGAKHELLEASGSSPILAPDAGPPLDTTSVSGKAGSPGDEAKPASPVGSAQRGLRERILELLTAHEPHKVDRIDRILELYKHREDEVITQLENRYRAPRESDSHRSEEKHHCQRIFGEMEPDLRANDAAADSKPTALTATSSVPTGHTAIEALDPSSLGTATPIVMSSSSSPRSPPVSETQLRAKHGGDVVPSALQTSSPSLLLPFTSPNDRDSSANENGNNEAGAEVATGGLSALLPIAAAVTEADGAPAPRWSAERTGGLAQPHRASPPRRGLPMAFRVAASHLEASVHKTTLQCFWSKWRMHRSQKLAAALLEDGWWIARPASSGGGYLLHDAVEPAYVVANLNAVVAQEQESRKLTSSSEMQVAMRSLLAALRRCVESRVVEIQSSEDRELAASLQAHWSKPENMCPVAESEDLVRALHQAAHFLNQLEDLMTVMRTQSGQLQQLKALQRNVLAEMQRVQERNSDTARLQAELEATTKERDSLKIQLKHHASAETAPSSPRSAAVGASVTRQSPRTPPSHLRATVEKEMNTQVAALEQELARLRSALFMSKEDLEKTNVKLQHSLAREARREQGERRREASTPRYHVALPVRGQPRSRSLRVGEVRAASRSSSAAPRSASFSTPRGAFSKSISYSTPRHRNPEPNRTPASSKSQTPWPSTRYVMTATAAVDRGPCPNCSTPLTSCSGEACGAAGDKAAFCFSCRRTFTFGELNPRGAFGLAAGHSW